MKSADLLAIVNDITVIHNDMQQNRLFQAGFSLCFLQQSLLKYYDEVKKEEENDKTPKQQSVVVVEEMEIPE